MKKLREEHVPGGGAGVGSGGRCAGACCCTQGLGLGGGYGRPCFLGQGRQPNPLGIMNQKLHLLGNLNLLYKCKQLRSWPKASSQLKLCASQSDLESQSDPLPRRSFTWRRRCWPPCHRLRCCWPSTHRRLVGRAAAVSAPMARRRSSSSVAAMITPITITSPSVARGAPGPLMIFTCRSQPGCWPQRLFKN